MAWWFRNRKSREQDLTTAGNLRVALHRVLAGDLPGAENALAEAAKFDSSSADIYLSLANLYRARGDIGRAIQVHQNLMLRKDLAESIRNEALLGLALDFRAGGFLKRAAASFKELLEAQPHQLEALRELERIHVESGEWEDAIRVRRQIGSKDPMTSNILAHLWTGLGRGHAKEGRASDARKAFRRALGQDRGCAEAYIALGDHCFREGKARKAIQHWRRALPLHPSIGVLLYPRLWEALLSADDLPTYESLMQERLQDDGDDHEASLWLARAIVKQGRIDEGLTRLRRMLDRTPQFLPAYAEIGRILLRENRDGEAVKTFEELLDRLPVERPLLRCHSCGTEDGELHWRCPQCGSWESFF